MVRQVPLQWPGTIPRLRPVDCSATPSNSMKWRSHADHGQKHETGDWMHSELDDQRPITEATEPNVRFSCARIGRRSGCGWSTAVLRICITNRRPELPAVVGRVQSESQALPGVVVVLIGKAVAQGDLSIQPQRCPIRQCVGVLIEVLSQQLAS
jgi:hypothetical protein